MRIAGSFAKIEKRRWKIVDDRVSLTLESREIEKTLAAQEVRVTKTGSAIETANGTDVTVRGGAVVIVIEGARAAVNESVVVVTVAIGLPGEVAREIGRSLQSPAEIVSDAREAGIVSEGIAQGAEKTGQENHTKKTGRRGWPRQQQRKTKKARNCRLNILAVPIR